MKYANRTKHNLNRVFLITYLTSLGCHYEYVKTENKLKAEEYGKKEADSYGGIVAEVKLSSLPKNLNFNESFTDLI